ncbi:MAG: right-handed parallel beta-helix repeat-containing protein [Kiritimatiellia bacterium]|jgi:hypothetical protein|nr:right-handed parallel beta-helix repeat-containing protein [Kiritimatiellia bacterium]MDP6848670.1 right-handed parallel beta-helix repeat-containing protein [Kiritimatiellia bacterium]
MSLLKAISNVLLYITFCTGTTCAADFYVAPNGNDAGPGTENKPFATIGKARDAVRAISANGLKNNITVQIRGGIYRIDNPVLFDSRDSGTDKFRITYEARKSETPVFSGARVISNWKVNSDGTWEAPVPADWSFRELFINEVRRPRCRHPNKGFAKVTKVINDRRQFEFKPGDFPRIADAGDTELVMLHDWSISRNGVKYVDGKTHVIETVYEIGGPARFWRINGFEQNPRFRLENHPVFLDAPGEWYLDRNANLLRYRPLQGEEPGEIQAVAPVAPQLLVLKGEKGKPVKNLHFRGLLFKHTHWQFEENRYGGGQACFHWSGTSPAGEMKWNWQPVIPALMFEFAESCGLENVSIVDVGGSGIWLRQGCINNSIVNSRIAGAAANGVMIGEHKVPEGATVASGNVIRNSVIEDCGVHFFGSVGVWIGLSNGNRIASNEIRRHPYTGISVGWRWNPTPTPCKANVVEDNHIHHVMQVLSDGGGIYTLGLQPGTVLRGNWIHDVPLNAGRAESNGMFLDEGTTGIVIENNFIHDIAKSPFRFHKATTNLLRNNTVVLGKDLPLVRYNNTQAKNIKQEKNRAIQAGSDEFRKITEQYRKSAGR